MSTGKKDVHYRLCLITRIGQVADELFSLINCFPQENYHLKVYCYPSWELEGVNQDFLEIASRDVELIAIKDVAELRRFQDENQPEGIVEGKMGLDVRVSPTQLRLMATLHMAKGNAMSYFSLNPAQENKGKNICKKLGIPEESPLVTLHIRDGASMDDMPHHGHRNANIDNYLPAIDYLISKGYYVIRLGDTSMKRLEKREGLVDAPFSPRYSGFFEPYFISRSQFFIGMPSGPSSIAVSFGVPVLYTDAPIHRNGWHHPGDLRVFKKIRDVQSKRFMTYEEAVCGECSKYYSASQFSEKGLELIDNTAEEILSSTQEMVERLSGDYQPDSLCQKADEHLREVHHKAHQVAVQEGSFFSFNFHGPSISHRYLLKHPELFGIEV